MHENGSENRSQNKRVLAPLPSGGVTWQVPPTQPDTHGGDHGKRLGWWHFTLQQEGKHLDMANPDGSVVVEGFESGIIDVHNEYLALVDQPGLVDPKEASLQIVRRILEAGSMEELEKMAGEGTLSADDMLDVPFTIVSDRWFRSSPQFQENSAGVFVVLTLERVDTGETLVVTNGGENVLAMIFRMHQLDGIPTSRPWKFTAVQTASGFRTYWIKPA